MTTAGISGASDSGYGLATAIGASDEGVSYKKMNRKKRVQAKGNQKGKEGDNRQRRIRRERQKVQEQRDE